MCGITGYLTTSHWLRDETAPAVLRTMTDTITHRGPDSADYWHDAAAGIALGHRRLSILELSPAGAQPMTSHCGRYVIAFNGEIYNHLDLRKQIDSVPWRGHSDTETLLAGFTAWGIRATIERCIGIFALALWDKKEQQLTLVRDRLGEKPLYYGWQGQGGQACFLFGSELKALKAHPAFAAPIDRDALCLFMRHNYIPAPYSIYQGIYKLPAATFLRVSLAQREPVIETYWSLAQMAVAAQESQLKGSAEEITDSLEEVLQTAVDRRMAAGGAAGAFLSGGVDSSTVAALMQSQSSRPVPTFAIGFGEEGYNEAEHAKAVARHLGTDHTELYVTARQAQDVIAALPNLYSEPFADSSQVPTFLVAQLARQKVSTVLCGDGGDELFAGYNRYVLAQKLWRLISRLPYSARSIAATSICAISPALLNQLLRPAQALFPRSLRQANPGDKLHKGAGVLAVRSADELYFGLVSHWRPHEVVIDGREPLTYPSGTDLSSTGLDEVQRMMLLDALTYLPDDGLVKVDGAAKGAGLQVRAPFLDKQVVEFGWRVPLSMKLRDGVGKWILRQVLYRHVPRKLIERPKMGFGIPLDAWLRGPLREWAEDLLSETRLHRQGYFHPAPIRQKWAEHLSGARNWQYHLWGVLMFQAWLENTPQPRMNARPKA